MLRLSERDRAEAIASCGAQLFRPSPGRAMKEYVELSPAMISDDATVRRWFERGSEYVSALPRKKKAK